MSVVVPFHDSAGFIDACVSALLSQRFPRDAYEIIMVDNNSTDGSAAIVRRYPGVRLLAETTPGSYAARNRGVREARGTIVAFTDSDCAPGPAWLETIWAAMANPGLALVQGRCSLGSESPPLRVLADYEAKKAAYVFTGDRKDIYYGYTNNMAVRRDAFDKVGPFQEWMRGADVMLVHRVLDEYLVRRGDLPAGHAGAAPRGEERRDLAPQDAHLRAELPAIWRHGEKTAVDACGQVACVAGHDSRQPLRARQISSPDLPPCDWADLLRAWAPDRTQDLARLTNSRR